MAYMFSYVPAFNQPLSKFNTSAVTDVSAYLCRVPTWWEARYWFPISTQLVIRWAACSKVPNCHHLILLRLRVWVYLCAESDLRTPNSDSLFQPTYYQMDGMFREADAFNQPLPSFDTSAVTDVSAYLCRVPTWWEARYWFPISTQLVIRCHGCSAKHMPSTNHCHHLTLPRLRMWVHICAESQLD